MRKIEVELGKVHGIENITFFQYQVLEGLVRGGGCAGIARDLNTNHMKVHNARKTLYDIFSVNNEVSLVLSAQHNGIIEIEIT